MEIVQLGILLSIKSKERLSGKELWWPLPGRMKQGIEHYAGLPTSGTALGDNPHEG